jgi:hypothetical protein
MGWEQIPLCPMLDKFDTDFGVDQWHGHNAFIHDGTKIYRTCFVSGRGDETMGALWSLQSACRRSHCEAVSIVRGDGITVSPLNYASAFQRAEAETRSHRMSGKRAQLHEAG